MKKHLLILSALGVFTATSNAAFVSIGFNFTSSDGDPNALASGGQTIWDPVGGFGTATAGAASYAQANWNHFRGDWGGDPVNDTTNAGLVTSTGAAVTNLDPHFGIDRVKYDSNNTFTSGIGSANANATLMNGYLDDGGGDQPYAEFDPKYDGETGADGITSYTFVLYLHGDGANASIGRYWLEDFGGTVLTDQVGITGNDYTGAFVSAGTFAATGTPSDVAGTSGGNYLVFTGITADTVRVRSAGNGDPEDFGRGPLNGVQVIGIPEPSGWILALFGSAGLLLRRRRK